MVGCERSAFLIHNHNTAKAPATIAPNPIPISTLPATPELAAAVAEVVVAADAEDALLLVVLVEAEDALAAMLLAAETADESEEAALPVTEEVVAAEVEAVPEDEALAVAAHVAAVGRLVTPWPAQRASAN